jgi:hypothetical protein
MTTTTVGRNAGVVVESNLPLTKAQIRDRLRQKYIDEREIEKRLYDENSQDDEDSVTEMEKSLEMCQYTDGIYGGEHPIDWETVQNLSFMNAFPEMELPSFQGRCVCPLSKKAREWRRRNHVSCEMEAHCGGNCNTDYDSRQSLEKHLRDRGKHEPMHKYALEFMEEWAKQH